MNVRLVPRYFVSDGLWAWFVEGFTSDDVRHWQLHLARLDLSGRPMMSRVHTYEQACRFLDRRFPVLTEDDVIVLTRMMGNMQRMCAGIPIVVARGGH